MGRKLTQDDARALLKCGKTLVRYPGGFWTEDGQPTDSFGAPPWYAGTTTIRALVKRGLAMYVGAGEREVVGTPKLREAVPYAKGERVEWVAKGDTAEAEGLAGKRVRGVVMAIYDGWLRVLPERVEGEFSHYRNLLIRIDPGEVRRVK